jgi:acyl-CoA synthetase (AMP-forming)/AMP-acid ligase II
MISPEGLSVPALLDAAALDNREAAVFPDGRASLTELSALSSSYARALVSLGVGPGDHVGALLPAGLPVVAFILGAGRIGAVAVPFNTRLRAGEIAYLVDHSDARVMLVSPEGADVGTPERMRYMQDRLPGAVQISCTGSTEGAGFVCVGDPADPPEARALYAGRPVAGMEARIVDPLTGADLPDHTPGEFVFRGVSRFTRYYRDPRTTAERIDDDGWYHSGDLLERDSQGRFRFHSRLSDVLKVGGENVSAAEVEDQIAGLPGVSVVQVVAAPDGHYGEVAAAFVELRPGASLTESEITGHCLERMATFKVPRYVRFVTEWPMSGTKIQKGRLRQRIADELAAASVTEAPRLSRPAAQAESA